ncbi:MAG: hypothetical protein GX825_04385 [Syntrophomonadaceae bacterium]|nr:hypothetical protein [Syntrophomonadaceae bacterium]
MENILFQYSVISLIIAVKCEAIAYAFFDAKEEDVRTKAYIEGERTFVSNVFYASLFWAEPGKSKFMIN